MPNQIILIAQKKNLIWCFTILPYAFCWKLLAQRKCERIPIYHPRFICYLFATLAFSFSPYTHSTGTCTHMHVSAYGTYLHNFYWNNCRQHDALPLKLPRVSSKDILLYAIITVQKFYITTIISNVNSLFKFLQMF